MASASQQYVDQYAEAAMEQQRKYGIPASVTLAQGILESANGKSQLSQECNNHFGVKASRTWLNAGGQYGLYTDDKPNEKFCKYATVEDSYEHHSIILKNSSRYNQCFQLPATDYKGWCQGLQRAGYASDKRYANSLISVIDRMDLTKYDRMAASMGPMKEEEKSVSQTTSASQSTSQSSSQTSSNTSGQATTQQSNGSYAFPLKRDEFMLVTSPYGNRKDPMNPSKTQFHKGVDIKSNGEAVMATEDNGKVIKVNNNANTGGGKSVTVEYSRADGSKYQTTCMHLQSISVKEGDAVKAGQQLGVSGNTGTRTTGPHLHFEVKQVTMDGQARDIDPAAYLADISEKGNIKVSAQHNGQNLLARYAGQGSPQASPELNPNMEPEDWMKKLLCSEDSGVQMPSNDPVMDMAITMFSSLMALAVQIDGKSNEVAMAAATDAAVNRQLDLSSLVSGAKSCVMNLREGKNPMLSITTSQGSFNHEFTNAEMARLSNVLNDANLSQDAKQNRVSSIVNNIVVANQMSQSFNQQVGNQQTSAIQR